MKRRAKNIKGSPPQRIQDLIQAKEQEGGISRRKDAAYPLRGRSLSGYYYYSALGRNF